MTLEYNDFDNAPRASAVKAACDANGLVFTIWMTRTFTAAQARQACIETGAAGFIAEAEIPAEDAPGIPKPEAQNWPELIWALQDLPIYKAVATNFAPFVYHNGTPYPEKSLPLVEANWKCITECYLSEAPNSTPENQAFFANHLGWAITQPVIGLYGGKTFADYPTRDNYPNWSVWDAEIL